MERPRLLEKTKSNMLRRLMCSWLIIRLDDESVAQILILPLRLETIMIRLPEDFQSGCTVAGRLLAHCT
jgi:hypothetical protein